jgi:hypothetical protein
MEEQRFFIKGFIYSVADSRLQDALARVYETPERPRCMCVRGGVEMYVAKHQLYVVKRMPGTGSRHHPACTSFDPEFWHSGLGELMGDAVIERSPEAVELRVDFPLARVPGKAIPRGEAVTPAEVNAPRHRMSLRAVMHYLFERAGFNRWTPAMEGKRSQAVIHKYLMEAAAEIEMKGARLSERLYVPEQFSEERKAEIAERRRAKLSIVLSPADEAQCKMALVLGELKGTETSTFGRKVWIKHMPDVPLFIDTKAWERIERVFGAVLEARDADTKSRLRVVICALVYAKRERTYQIDTASLMLTTEHWIPIEGMHEVGLLEALSEQKRRFLKPLLYDARSAAPFANALLLDTGDTPTPLHVVSSFMDAKERTAKEKVVKTNNADVWIWYTDEPMPAFARPGASGDAAA